jgi:arsenate reductase (thioredoxin)
MSGRVRNVLFLCTGNSARSVMAEALLNELGKGRFKAYSAGSAPAGRVNPFTIEQLQKHGHPVDGLRSKSWEEFARPDAPRMDFVVTVCDHAAGEACPVWPGRPMGAHWGFEDPAAFRGSDEQKRARFAAAYLQIAARVRILAGLPAEHLDRDALQRCLRDIGTAPV